MESAAPRKTPPRLAKWPFVLGDFMLIALAVLVLILSRGDLNSWQIAFCVMAVVAGALLLVAPFVGEFYMVQRIRQEEDARAVDTILRRINAAVGEIMEMRRGQKDELRQLEHTLSAYEGLGGILEQRLRGMQKEDRALREVQDEVKSLADLLESLTVEVSALRSEWSGLAGEYRQARLSPPSQAPKETKTVEGPSPASELLPKESRMWKKAQGAGDRKPEPPEKPSPVERVIRSSEEPPKKAPPAVVEEESAPEPKAPVENRQAGLVSAVLRANILIGIGNKIHVRGEGGGLAADQGEPMSFVEIGLFEWVSEPTEEPLEVRLFLNDEVEAIGGPWRLQPGQTLEVTPEFPN